MKEPHLKKCPRCGEHYTPDAKVCVKCPSFDDFFSAPYEANAMLDFNVRVGLIDVTLE